MRRSFLRNKLELYGASFDNRYGIEVASSVSDFLTEHSLIRNSVGITDFSSIQMFTISEEKGIDFLDDIFPGNVAKVRFGRILHTFLADDNGYLVADCYIANNDEELIVLCESIVDESVFKDIFNGYGAVEAGLECLNDFNVLIGIDGYKAWSVVKEIFGTDVLGLPYLSIETYPFQNSEVRFFRTGKTSEFGYLVMAPNEIGESLLELLLETAKKYGGGLCGVDIHNGLRLEGRFFNIFSEGVLVKDPLILGLQWMIDFDKEKFSGYNAIMKRREEGLTHKIIGVRAEDKGADSAEEFIPGVSVYNGENEVAVVKVTCYSPVLDCKLGLALFPVELAFSGLSFRVGSSQGAYIKTISMPPIMPKSLTVKLDEM